MPRIKFTPFLPTQTMKKYSKSENLNEKHIRISRSMLYSEAFMSLNAIALKLYMVLRIKFYNEEEKSLDFEFSKSLGVKIFKLSEKSEKTIRNGLKELVKKGFLEQTLFSQGGGKNNKISNRYKFSSNWKDSKKIYSEDKRYKNSK